MPVSGQTKYLDGDPFLGCGRLAMRDVFEAFDGIINIFCEDPVLLERWYFEVDLGVSAPALLDGAGFVDRVLVIAAL